VREAAVASMLERYKGALAVPAKQLPALLSAVHDTFKERYAVLLNLDPERSVFFRNARAISVAFDQAEGSASRTQGSPEHARPKHDAKAEAESKKARLARRLDELEAMVKEPHDAGAALGAMLDAFGSGFGLRRVLVLAQGKDRGTLRVKAAWGEDAKLLQEELVVPISSSLADDVFSVAWHSGADVAIVDAFDDKNTRRVPRVYYEYLGSAAFVIYPCGARGGATKLFFADSDRPGAMPAPDELTLVNRFRALVERATLPGAAQAGRDVRPLAPKRV